MVAEEESPLTRPFLLDQISRSFYTQELEYILMVMNFPGNIISSS